ncbi:hypothetical protein [Haloactinomyces albus]|uniref:Uncharacterized protein n=1 Tax=Haloactinomyces albus TaxID=1352928 RepID=A0AAE3ZDL9_9ACTN|nr:hypothetical protein [Haloactinomyces albus]MDR7301950.1 hypothetical protein [Haloactinomyces albus]
MSPQALLAMIAPPGFGVVSMLGAVAVLTAVAGVIPLRGGHGQHADAGPGALSVWQLHEPAGPEFESPLRHDARARDVRAEIRLPAARPTVREPDPEEIDWPDGDWSNGDWPDGDPCEPEYVGRHRLLPRPKPFTIDLAFSA